MEYIQFQLRLMGFKKKSYRVCRWKWLPENRWIGDTCSCPVEKFLVFHSDLYDVTSGQCVSLKCFSVAKMLTALKCHRGKFFHWSGQSTGTEGKVSRRAREWNQTAGSSLPGRHPHIHTDCRHTNTHTQTLTHTNPKSINAFGNE